MQQTTEPKLQPSRRKVEYQRGKAELSTEGPQWKVHLFIDSAVALGTLLRGSSRQVDWNVLVAEIWFRAASLGLALMAWRVPSAQNLADAPTRPVAKAKALRALEDNGFRRVGWPRGWRGPWAQAAEYVESVAV